MPAGPTVSRSRTATTFLLLALSFGTILAFVTPPFQAPDEFAHFFRAYAVSEGRFAATVRDRRVGDELPRSLDVASASFRAIPFHPERRVGEAMLAQAFAVPLEPGDRAFFDFWNTALSPPLLYLPQAAGIALGRALGLGPLALLYAARLFNLAAFTALVFGALRATPFGRALWLLLATLPMTLFLAASLSHDATTIGLSFLWTGLVLRLASGEGVAPRARLAPLLALAPAMGWIKLPYATLLLLFLLIPRARFPSSRERWTWFAAIAGLAACFWLGWAARIARYGFVYRDYDPAHRDTLPIFAGADPELQLQLVRAYPVDFLRMIGRSFRDWEHLRSFAGHLGWADTPLPVGLYAGIAASILLVLALGDRRAATLSPAQRAICLAVSLASAFGLMILVYVTLSPVGAPVVSGFQGRYLIPVAPVFFLGLLHGRRSAAAGDPPWLGPALVSWIACSLLTTTAVLARRFWGA